MVNENQPVMYIALTKREEFDAMLVAIQKHKIIAVPYAKSDGTLGFRKVSVMTVYRSQ